ncbi:hypothetical protein [Anaerotruncus colihominis]|uniref:hypothetical protein n=1 Tax=Anaerotruncus colihominis TaxID=169435 RepID=UPI001A9BC969|nr:hypothetical protein [Anaerotruncus colihominis]
MQSSRQFSFIGETAKPVEPVNGKMSGASPFSHCQRRHYLQRCGLHVKRAAVTWQLQPGVPIWLTGTESKFPGLIYVIFPSNAQKDNTLKKAVEQLLNPA